MKYVNNFNAKLAVFILFEIECKTGSSQNNYKKMLLKNSKIFLFKFQGKWANWCCMLNSNFSDNQNYQVYCSRRKTLLL